MSIVFTEEDMEELRESLFQELSPLAPNKSVELTDMILEMSDDEIIQCFADDSNLEAQATRLMDCLRRRDAVEDGEQVDDERNSVDSEPDEGWRSPSTRSIGRGVVLMAQPEDGVEIYHIEDRDRDTIAEHDLPSTPAGIHGQTPSREHQSPGCEDLPLPPPSPTGFTMEDMRALEDIVRDEYAEINRRTQQNYGNVTQARHQRNTTGGPAAGSVAPQAQEPWRVATIRGYGSCNAREFIPGASDTRGINREPAAAHSRTPLVLEGRQVGERKTNMGGRPQPDTALLIQHAVHVPFGSPPAFVAEQPSRTPLMQPAQRAQPEDVPLCTFSDEHAVGGYFCCISSLGLVLITALALMG